MAGKGDVSDVTSESSDSTGYSSDEDRDPSRSSSHTTPMIVVSNRCHTRPNKILNILNITPKASLCTEEDGGRESGPSVKV